MGHWVHKIQCFIKKGTENSAQLEPKNNRYFIKKIFYYFIIESIK